MAKRCAAGGPGVGMVKLSTTTSLTKSAARANEEYEKHNKAPPGFPTPAVCLRKGPGSKRWLLEGFGISLEHTRAHTLMDSDTESPSVESAILDQDQMAPVRGVFDVSKAPAVFAEVTETPTAKTTVTQKRHRLKRFPHLCLQLACC